MRLANWASLCAICAESEAHRHQNDMCTSISLLCASNWRWNNKYFLISNRIVIVDVCLCVFVIVCVCARAPKIHTKRFAFSVFPSRRWFHLVQGYLWYVHGKKANFVHIHYSLYTEPSGTIRRKLRHYKCIVWNIKMDSLNLHTCVSPPLLVGVLVHKYVYVLAHRSLLHHRISLWHCLTSSSSYFSFQSPRFVSCAFFAHMRVPCQFALALARTQLIMGHSVCHAVN